MEVGEDSVAGGLQFSDTDESPDDGPVGGVFEVLFSPVDLCQPLLPSACDCGEPVGLGVPETRCRRIIATASRSPRSVSRTGRYDS